MILAPALTTAFALGPHAFALVLPAGRLGAIGSGVAVPLLAALIAALFLRPGPFYSGHDVADSFTTVWNLALIGAMAPGLAARALASRDERLLLLRLLTKAVEACGVILALHLSYRLFLC